VHLDMTGDCHMLYLGTHIPNSAEQTGTVLLDPCVTPDRASVDHTACQEGMERYGQVATHAYRISDG
jgi:hypothetical protein